MIRINPITRSLPILVCASFVSLLAACGPSNGGYYDANGNFVQAGAPYPTKKTARYSDQNDMYGNDYYANRQYDDNRRREYTRYDHNGYPVNSDGLAVPDNMMPPRGMCRIWFPQRPMANQPSVESCDNIRTRVPHGAFVIYGG